MLFRSIRSDKEIRSVDLPKGARVYTGEHAMDDVREDILFLSPSVKRDRFQNLHGVMLSSDYEMFLNKNKKPIFAVTGSDGKSTTTRLVSLLLRASGQAVNKLFKILFYITLFVDVFKEFFLCEFYLLWVSQSSAVT